MREEIKTTAMMLVALFGMIVCFCTAVAIGCRIFKVIMSL